MSNYYISELIYGEDGVQPFNFVTIGGNLALRKSYSFIGENAIAKQYKWYDNLDKRLGRLLRYQTSSRSKPSDNQLVINTSSSKLKITFLNATLPTPLGKYINYYLISHVNNMLYLATMITSLYILPLSNSDTLSHILNFDTIGE